MICKHHKKGVRPHELVIKSQLKGQIEQNSPERIVHDESREAIVPIKDLAISKSSRTIKPRELPYLTPLVLN